MIRDFLLAEFEEILCRLFAHTGDLGAGNDVKAVFRTPLIGRELFVVLCESRNRYQASKDRSQECNGGVVSIANVQCRSPEFKPASDEGSQRYPITQRLSKIIESYFSMNQSANRTRGVPMKGVYDPGLPFKLSSVYGDRPHPKNPNTREFHAGVDYAAPAGTPIPAATSGVVVYSGRNSGFGNTVVVRNATGDYSLYAQMQDGDRAKVGQRVWPGDTLGQVGSTGAQAKGNHLHYSLLPASAREAIENPNFPRDGGPIGIQVNKANTIDPAKYDPQPYLDESKRAAEIFSGVDEKSSRNAGVSPDRLGRRFFNPFDQAPVAGFVALPTAPSSDAPASFKRGRADVTHFIKKQEVKLQNSYRPGPAFTLKFQRWMRWVDG